MNLSSLKLPASWFIYLHLLLLLFTFKLRWFVPNTIASALGNETDHLALLKFKELIFNDPYGILDSWNSSTHFCNWLGVTCNPMHQRVIQLNLHGYALNGTISPQVGNLSFLRVLGLGNNNFYGTIPPELGRLLQLQGADLSNNSFHGDFPTNLTNCFELKELLLYGINLIGKIPVEIGSLRKLQVLSIGRNKLTGQIPASIGNLSSLLDLFMGENYLEGDFPQEIGHLRNLTYIQVGENKLSGMLPSTLFNMSSLIAFAAVLNQFNGSLPSNMFHTLPNLQEFGIGGNQISGPIPISIANASVLQLLDIGNNYFVGQVPSLGKLQDIEYINLGNNSLGGSSTHDFDFLEPLTNCSKLHLFSISFNNFGGYLPNFIGNLSTQLSQLYLGYNQISGKIPTGLVNLNNLTLLNMDSNHFDGIIPTDFGKFRELQILELDGNKLSGDIPTSIGNLSKLFTLSLAQNMLEGNIPPSIGNCQKLQSIYLAQNNLTGPIPLEVFSLSSLTKFLDLSQNLFSGSLPDEVGRLKNIEKLDVSYNHLSDNIPGTIGECMSLEYLYLQGNSFNGVIPTSLSSLKGLQHLDLSQNHLSGSIPEGMQNISALEYLNVSFNMLDGEVPTGGVFQNSSRFSITGNSKLCGGISYLHLPSCPIKGRNPAKHHGFRKLIAVIVSVVAFLLILSFSLTIYWMRKRNNKPSFDSPTIDHFVKVSYQNLYNGTDGFSGRNLIGSGNFGFVYKGTLELEDKIVAIKVLNLQKKGAHKSFIAECDALRNMRHRNLVKILTCCSSTDYKGQAFKALVFEYMTNGSLERWLHPETETTQQSRPLNVAQRLNIISDVASAIHYLHYECEQAVIHCDLKPSNILLDDCLVAHVSDFGIARLLSSIGGSPKQTSTTGIKGTIGYAPPEYGMGSEVSIEGDMYSFGILVLEMLTGRRPTDEMFKDGQTLHNYVRISIPNHLSQIVDPTILPKEFKQDYDNEIVILKDPNVKEYLLSLFSVALACSVESPKQRMSMVDVIKELNLIKSSFFLVMESDCITNTGPIPISITNASFLQLLDISYNHFVGQVPSLGKLQDIQHINLGNNSLGGNSTHDFDFLEPLTNCSKLHLFSISYNNFGGYLPNIIGNLSTQLSQLYLGYNQISGKIPTELVNLNNLIILNMDSNHFDGIIPTAFGKFREMQTLGLDGNKLSGDIPTSIGNLSKLFSLSLAQNMLEGNIPPSIGNCQKLQSIYLAQNNLTGPIPLEVFSLSALTKFLDLSQNLFSGSLPDEVGRLKNIQKLDVSDNHLSGNIPGTIGECMILEHLCLQGNSFNGIISSSLASLKGLQRLDLSQNHLSGSIPKGMQSISVLEYLNVSFNMLDGEVPTEGVFQNSSRFSITGNSKLCGGISNLHLPSCPVKGRKPAKHHSFKKLIAVIVFVVAFLLILSFSLTIYWMRKRNKKPSFDSPTIDHLVKVSYQNLHNGTDGFSDRNLIGSGNFGSVYKGTLESEDKVVAIKVLNLQKNGAHKSFIAECNVLRNVRHRNLVKILTCCSSTDYKGQEFKALVFELMTNGSLESWLHPATETAQQSIPLNFAQRLNIITDVASAIHYLHHECEQLVIHCDLKPSNILLDDGLVAHVSDFGIARLLSSIAVSPKQTSTTGIKGTIGYAPPEYGMGSEVSIEGDMYSFGILVLEMLTGRRPTNEMFKDGQTLHNYVRILIPNHLSQIVDPTILPKEFEQDADNESVILTDPNVKECLLSLFSIALACSVESPKQRMNMFDVIKELNLIKSSF